MQKPPQTWADAAMDNMHMYPCVMEKGEAVDYFLDKKWLCEKANDQQEQVGIHQVGVAKGVRIHCDHR